jgi:hypothetical protein
MAKESDNSAWSFSGFMDNNSSWISGISEAYSGIKSGEAQLLEAQNKAKALELEEKQNSYEKLSANAASSSMSLGGMSQTTIMLIAGGAIALLLVLKK